MHSAKSYFFGAAADGRGTEGYIVNRIANAGGKPRIALASANALTALGVVLSVKHGTLGQQASVCVAGECKVRVGAGWTPGTTRPFFASDANGQAVPVGDGDNALGYLVFSEGVAPAAGALCDAIISPMNKET